MTLRTLSLALVAGLAMTTNAAAEKLSLNELSRYLNTLKQAKGSFTQINSDGTISTGTIFLKRPGRVRFEYNPPEQALVLAGGGAVAIIDKKVKTSEQYPLKRTPLSIILAQNVNLAQANMVTGHSSDGTSTTVRAQDPEHPEYGNIELVFTGNPTELRQWRINDDAGNSTTVILGELDKSASLGEMMFSIPFEIDRLER
ncbi:outer membrane lipoprotein carrier protein LolA [Mesobacterium sp. TK19101]|uniref:Outer membrane lipoprotein carrier protein LolA n=1 Tax=Mesobacterium hydrothermale TaxID=3111907 RepID=A0ABU6HHF9_9RHOB|nr:outer membrane lipoprotein carrier protein LolA [Mesobacterium sp. TK19101]MEC3861847.1 outer membrane lipoprotein carrier protein LolA [Mesobacterium sp. TK19101]